MTQHVYGCHNRPEFVAAYKVTGGESILNAFVGQGCKYTLSELGRVDKACLGCKWKAA